MTVSLCVIAYNEEKALVRLLEDIVHQQFDKKETELVFVDSGSEDGTKELFLAFQKKYTDSYGGIQVLDNPRRMQAAGWNTAIRAARGDVIVRVDAHASIPADFLTNNMQLIGEGEFVCGGARPSRIDEPTPYREMLLAAESSMFGSSIASYRRKSEGKQYVNSLFHGAYRREVFARVGGFDTSLGRTEDNELHYRIRQNGFRICQSDRVLSYQNIRPSMTGMLRQKFGNGKWIGLTLGRCPGCLSLFHFVPLCFVLAIIFCTALWLIGLVSGTGWLGVPMLLLWAAYALADAVMTVGAVLSAEHKSVYMVLLPMVFLLLHIIYGCGTLTGVVMLPHWKRQLDGSAEAEIEEVRQCVLQHQEGLHEFRG